MFVAQSPPARKTPAPTKRDEYLVTRPTVVDPELLAATRLADAEARRRRWWEQTWLTVRFVGAGFLLGAIAVHAVASVRMARKIDALKVLLEQAEQRLAQPRESRLVLPTLDP